tara:strand:- start:716 stop:958 length:243 start_codon:yes stop_codon:yes gene_type:complete
MEKSILYALKQLDKRPELITYILMNGNNFLWSKDIRTIEIRKITDDGTHEDDNLEIMLRLCQQRLLAREVDKKDTVNLIV